MRSPLLIAASILLITGNLNAQQNNSLSPESFQQQTAINNSQILDVRTSGEYQTGHIQHALLADWTQKQQFFERIKYVDKTKPVYVYCLSGARSSAAAAWMRQNGFSTVYELNGGINAWKKENLPVEAAAAVKQMTLQEFNKQVGSTGTVLVDFGAVWCPPCKKMEPVLATLQQKQGKNLRIVKIDGASQTLIMNQLKVEGIPTIIIYKNGIEKWRKQGIAELEELTDAILKS